MALILSSNNLAVNSKIIESIKTSLLCSAWNKSSQQFPMSFPHRKVSVLAVNKSLVGVIDRLLNQCIQAGRPASIDFSLSRVHNQQVERNWGCALGYFGRAQQGFACANFKVILDRESAPSELIVHPVTMDGRHFFWINFE